MVSLIYSFQLHAQESSIPKFRMNAEIGYLGVLEHKIQFSNSGTYINYVTQGGQDNLFPISRFSLDFNLTRRSSISLLYQPLKLETTQFLEEDLVIDEEIFPAGKGVKFLYNFPFYRISYLYELLPNNPNYDLGVGLSMQLRNATISFESVDGLHFRRNSDIGIVPILKVKGYRYFGKKFFAGIEADGFYAPVSYLNGSDNEVIGAILDASLRGGFSLTNNANTFLNLRYLGGGAVGTGDPDGPGDGYVRNWLNFLTVTAGFSYEFY